MIVWKIHSSESFWTGKCILFILRKIKSRAKHPLLFRWAQLDFVEHIGCIWCSFLEFLIKMFRFSFWAQHKPNLPPHREDQKWKPELLTCPSKFCLYRWVCIQSFGHSWEIYGSKYFQEYLKIVHRFSRIQTFLDCGETDRMVKFD